MKDFSHFIKVKIKLVVPLFTIFYVKYIWTTNKIRTKFSNFNFKYPIKEEETTNSNIFS